MSYPIDTYRVLVTGSRRWSDIARLEGVLDRIRAAVGQVLVVVHGACPTGADAIADAWCTRTGVAVERHPANWSTYGASAGPTRNTAMVATDPALCLAFIRDNSPGASHCAQTARAAGIPTVYYGQDGAA